MLAKKAIDGPDDFLRLFFMGPMPSRRDWMNVGLG
jgi:hypothetical protein